MSGQSANSWRFLVDENLPRTLVADLMALGHHAEHIYDLGMGGSKVQDVWAYAQSQGLTIITGDKDFSDLRAFSLRILALSWSRYPTHCLQRNESV